MESYSSFKQSFQAVQFQTIGLAQGRGAARPRFSSMCGVSSERPRSLRSSERVCVFAYRAAVRSGGQEARQTLLTALSSSVAHQEHLVIKRAAPTSRTLQTRPSPAAPSVTAVAPAPVSQRAQRRQALRRRQQTSPTQK